MFIHDEPLVFSPFLVLAHSRLELSIVSNTLTLWNETEWMWLCTSSSVAIASQFTPAYFTTSDRSLVSSSCVHFDVLMAGWPAFFQNSLQLTGVLWPSNCPHTHRHAWLTRQTTTNIYLL